MATTIDRSQPSAGAPAALGATCVAGANVRSAGSSSGPGSSCGSAACVLLVLAVGHTLIMHLPSGGVDRVDFGFVAARWNSPFWRTWDWMLLTLALIHGINGLRNITLDYVRKPGLRFALNMAYYVLGFTLFILGTVIVVTFDPTKWGPVA